MRTGTHRRGGAPSSYVAANSRATLERLIEDQANKKALMAAAQFMLIDGLNRIDKALTTAAFAALIDVMHEARLVRFGFVALGLRMTVSDERLRLGPEYSRTGKS